MQWLPIVNYTGVRDQGGWLIMMDVSNAILHNLELVRGMASHPIHRPGSASDDVTTYRFVFVVQQCQSLADGV